MSDESGDGNKMDRVEKTAQVTTGRWGFYFFLAVAVAIKFWLFFHIINRIPGAVLDPDSYQYLFDGESIRNFFLRPELGLTNSRLPTPGYPLFLAICRHGLGLGIHQVIFMQILLNFVAALLVSRIAWSLNPRWEMLSAFIVLLDIPLTVYSQLIMTESLFIVVLACFILNFHRYLLLPSYQRLILAALFCTLCVYVRPIAYFLAWPAAAFIIYSRCPGNWKKTLIHAGLVILIFYGLCLPWQYRNLKRYGDFRMSSIADQTSKVHSFFKDSEEKKALVAPGVPNYIYYPIAFSRNVVELLTTPGSTKHCDSRPLLIFCKVFGYMLIVFWLPGFLVGLTWGGKDPRYSFLIWIFLYFLFVTIGATGWTVTSRFRVAMLPSIAIIATAGWFKIRFWWQGLYLKRRELKAA